MFVRWVVLSLACVTALAAAFAPRRLRSAVERLGRPRLDRASATGKLQPEEIATVVAFAEVLVEGSPLLPAQRQFLVEHLDERTLTAAGYLSLYRKTARTLDGSAGRSFTGLDFDQRVALVGQRQLGRPVRLREQLLPFRRDELAVRALARPDLIRGYYRSPGGWAVVGYSAFPGRCGDLVRYTRSEP